MLIYDITFKQILKRNRSIVQNQCTECFGHVGHHLLHKMFYTADKGLCGRNVVCVDFVQIICYVPD